jgi:CubicO group peptidase (beta-lactamase class C family)
MRTARLQAISALLLLLSTLSGAASSSARPKPASPQDVQNPSLRENTSSERSANTEDEIVFPGAIWEFKTPAEVGLDAGTLDQFIANVGGVGVIVKDGYMIQTWGDQTAKADWASASKPVMSTLLFFAVNEGKLSGVDDLIYDWGWDLTPADQTMTFRHLANMISGYALPEAPGEAWGYNDYAISLYAKTLADLVFAEGSMDAAATHPARLGALQVEDGSLFSSRGGYGLSTTARDFARIGWFWLNRGNWDGTQLLPQTFFDMYMQPDVPGSFIRTQGGTDDYLNVGSHGGGTNQTPYGPGIYGFNWWFNAPDPATSNLTWPDAPTDTFQANGHWNQEVMTVIPSLNMVVAARGDWGSFEPGNASAGMNQNLKLLADAVQAPLPGQIIVDPDYPEWLKYAGGGPFFMCGPGDPEDFLYRGSLNPDGTRKGDQMVLIDKLAGTGANSIYFQAIRSHGGDGDATHNPFVNNDPAQGFNDAVLDQWETWFADMDQQGITIFFFIYDDSARIWDTGDVVSAEEQVFLQTLVDRFEHHKHLIWVVAEEYGERYTAARVSNIAAEIRAADNHDHVIAVHKNNGLDFSEFATDPNIDQFAVQYNVDDASALHAGMVTAWTNAAGQYNLNMSEAANYGSGSTARQKNWATATGGAYVMILGMDIASTPVSDLEDCGRVVSFMESTDFNRMSPHDELAVGGSEYVLALPGVSYIAYASNLVGELGLKNMTPGSYDFSWFDPISGVSVTQQDVVVSGGDQTWPAPGGFGGEVAVYITLTSIPNLPYQVYAPLIRED